MEITGLVPGMEYHFAGCCHAVPGDDIVGIIFATGKGVTIHAAQLPDAGGICRDTGTIHRCGVEHRGVGPQRDRPHRAGEQ